MSRDDFYPRGPAGHHGVDDGEQLAHRRDQGHLLRLTRGKEPIIEGLNRWVVPTTTQGGHVEHRTNLAPPTPHSPSTAKGPTVAVQGGDTHQGGDFLAVQSPQLREGGDQ